MVKSLESPKSPESDDDARIVISKELAHVSWKTRSICLRHGESFHWKERCEICHYLIRFQERTLKTLEKQFQPKAHPINVGNLNGGVSFG